MNRNVSIVVVLLVLVVIAGYLVWLRSKVASPVAPNVVQVTATPLPADIATASPSATLGASVATGSANLKTATPGATRR